MTKSYDVRQEYCDKCRAEANRIMARFDIKDCRCGFGLGLGWMPTVERAFEKMVAAGWDKDLQQVKQKFCGLRIYIGFGGHDDVDNPLKKIVRATAQGLARLCLKIRFVKMARLLFNIRDSNLIRQWRPNAIAKAIDEAEAECDKICEVCGNEREKKGVGSGWALCNACAADDGKSF